MKTVILSLALMAGTGLAVGAQVGQDLKNAGSDTKDAAKTGAVNTKNGVKKAGKATAHGVKKGVNKAAGATANGANKVADKTSH